MQQTLFNQNYLLSVKVSFWRLFLLSILMCLFTQALVAQVVLSLTSSGQTGITNTWTNTTGEPIRVRITAQGGGGGKESRNLGGCTGAIIEGEFIVQPCEKLLAIAGAKGGNSGENNNNRGNGGGGGAGSGVVNTTSSELLILAAGGTGAPKFSSGLGGSGSLGGSGDGGGAGVWSTGGGGFNGPGLISSSNGCSSSGGQVRLTGISPGGFRCSFFSQSGSGGSGMGGGGGASDLAGGGGGYTGGSGGSSIFGPYTAATSYNVGTNQVNTNGANDTEPNDGTVVIEIITPNPPAPVATPSAQTICTGSTMTTIALTSNVTGTTYTWTRDNTPSVTGIAASGTGNISGVLTNTTTAPVTVTFTISPSYTNGGTTCTGSPITATVLVNPILIPSIALTATATTICSGTQVTFTATPTNGGTPQYKWYLNNILIVGETGNTLIRSNLANNDVVKVEMVSNATCAATTPVSDAKMMTVNPVLIPSVALTAPATTICSGTQVTFTATPTNGGTPQYKWYLNNILIVGETGNTLIRSNLTNNDVVKIEMVSNATCAVTAPVSDAKTMTVNPILIPSVALNATATTICSGTQVTFTATPTNGGTPQYKWYLNNILIVNETTNQLIRSNLANNDVVKVEMVSNAACATTAPVSDIKTMTVNPILIPSVALTATATTICSGTQVTFTATPTNGGTPQYKWYLNNILIANETANQLIRSNLANNDVVKVEMVSNATCAATTPVSDAKTMTVNSRSTAPTSISGTINICLGNSTTLTVVGGSAGTGALAEWFTGSCGGTSAATGNSIIVAPTVATTYFVRYKGTCNTTACTSVSVSITTPSVGGTVSPAQTQGCGPQTVTLSVSGITGVVTQWERQTNCNGAWASIGNAGLTTITVTTPNASTCYRAVITNGVCPSANSSISTITVDKPAVGGRVTLQSNQTATSIALCPSQNALLIPLGFTGKVANWQYSFGTSSIWYDLPGTAGQTTLTVNGSTISGTVFYRVVIVTDLGICTGQSSVAYSLAFRITKKAGCLSPEGSLVNNNIQTNPHLTIQKVYPNPARDFVSIEIESSTEGVALISLIDITGKPVFSTYKNLSKGRNDISIDISALPSGIYLCQLKDGQHNVRPIKLVKD